MVNPDKFEVEIRNKYVSILQSGEIVLNTQSDILSTTIKLIKTRVRIIESMGAAVILQNEQPVGLIISRPDYQNGTNIFKIIDHRGTIIYGMKPKFYWMLQELPKKLQWESKGRKGGRNGTVNLSEIHDKKREPRDRKIQVDSTLGRRRTVDPP